jgi:NAD(P)-dependent dehydrogenase (short-subunit alcohol dehydrogenase family)
MTSTSQALAGKVAVVTGGSRGLGRSMVIAFAQAGATVVIASRKLEACQKLADEVSNQYQVEAIPISTNVSKWTDCEVLASAVHDRFAQVDVLVNNAGMSPLYPTLDQVSEELYDKVLGVNLKGPFRLTSLVGTTMAAGTGGSIINISSVESSNPEPRALPYAAAKAGLESLTIGFARAFGPKVRVNTIQCGMFRTDIAAAWGDPDTVSAYARKRTALTRIGETEDIVGAALYLATDASAYCTGAILRLDGGILG